QAPLKALSRVTRLCVLSASVIRGLEDLWPPLREARVVLGGVNCADADASAAFMRDRPYFMTASRLELNAKAIDVLVAGFAQIAQVYPEIDFLIVGEGPDRDRIAAMVAEANLATRIEVLGVVPRAMLWSLYKGAQFFVMASRRAEGLGLVFLES